MNRKVTLMYYCKTDAGWKRLPAVIGKNGRVRPGYALEGDSIREYPQGQYQLRFYDGSKVRYESVGGNAADALNAWHQKQLVMAAHDAASNAGAVIVEEPSRVSLRGHLARFIQTVQDRGSDVAAKVYRLSANEFLAVTGKRYADEITADDIGMYQRALRKRKLSDRTIFNRHANVKPFLRFCGLDTDKLAPSSPAYEESLPEVYGADELKAFMESLTDEYSRLAFTLLLKCGLREQEAMFLCWSDINFQTRTLTVRGKVDLGFKVKDKEQRSIPIADDLVQMLKEWKASHPASRLVLETSTGKPNTKLLLLLKRRVRAAGLNCGGCEGCASRQECGGWYLHKFRSTYCTKLLRSGMDIRTVQSLMGHSDLQTTMKYLRPHETDAVRERVEAIDWSVD